MKKRNEELRNESITKLLWKYSIPAMAGTLVYILYNLVDRIFISFGLGRLAIAGISITLPIFTFILAISLLIGIGSGVLISLNLGAGKYEEADKILGVATLLFVTIGIGFSIFGSFFIDKILTAFGATENNLIYAREYMRIIFAAAPFQLISIGMNNIIRGEGSPKISMYMNFVGAILNIILDPIFIFTLKMGIAGAAYATIIANIVTAVLQLMYFVNGKSKLRFMKKYIKFDFKIIKKIFSIGISPFVMQLSNSVVVIFINKNLNIYGGDIAIAAFGIINSINTLLFMPIVGIYQGSQPIIGFNYGAKKYKRVKETYIKALFIAFSITVIGFILIMFLPHILISPFIRNDIQLEELTVKSLRIMFSMILFLGLNTIGGNYFQSIGNSKITALINILKQIILMLGFLYILPKKIGLNGVWLSVPLTEVITFSVVCILVIKELKRLKTLSQAEDKKIGETLC